MKFWEDCDQAERVKRWQNVLRVTRGDDAASAEETF
jgi:hypothetical protein